ncbi:MAG: flagellar basal body protein, partial [Terracidiphilus sp.]
MDSGYYAAMTGLVARTQALDIAATNLANAQTPGYRAEQEYFRSVLLGPDAQDSQLGQTVNNFGLLGGDRL